MHSLGCNSNSADMLTQQCCIHQRLCLAGSTLSTLFTVPFSKKRKRENEQKQQLTGQAQKGSKQTPFPAAHYAVTLQQMEANLYPLPVIDDDKNMTCPDGFVATQPAGMACLQCTAPSHHTRHTTLGPTCAS